MKQNMGEQNYKEDLPNQIDRIVKRTMQMDLPWEWSCGVAYYGIAKAYEKTKREGLIVIRYYLALRGAENGVTAMVTPFFCVQG